jgi:hypothetical protein
MLILQGSNDSLHEVWLDIALGMISIEMWLVTPCTEEVVLGGQDFLG